MLTHFGFKGGCAHFTMCILHFQLIDLDLWNVFCEVSPWGNFLFTLQRQNKLTMYATLGMRLWCKYIRNYLLVYQLTSHFLPYLRNYKEFEGEISDLQLEKYGLSFETKKYTNSIWARGDENVIGIRAFKRFQIVELAYMNQKCVKYTTIGFFQHVQFYIIYSILVDNRCIQTASRAYKLTKRL